MIDLVNAAVTGNSTTNSRRPDGQPETPQANIRQEPRAQQPQVQPPASPQQTQAAVNQAGSNDGVALLNNREQAAASAIQQRAATPEPSQQRIQVDTDPVVQPQQGRQSTEAAIESSIRINTQQQPTTPQAAQQLANTAESALANVRQQAQQQPAREQSEPVAERLQRQAEQADNNRPRDVSVQSDTPETTEVVRNAAEQTFEARPPVQAGAGQAPQADTAVAAPQQQTEQVQVQQQQAQQAQFQQNEAANVEEQQQPQQTVQAPADQQAEAAPQQVGFGTDEGAQTDVRPAIPALDPQAVVGDILRPDFNQFVGLRASVPASAQEPQANEAASDQGDNDNNDQEERQSVDIEA